MSAPSTKATGPAPLADPPESHASPFQGRGEIRYVPLSRTGMIEAVRRYQKGDRRAETEIICGNVAFVRKRVGVIMKRRIFKGLLGASVEFKDVLQDGLVGLMTAADRFDCDRGYAFITYAGWWVDHEIIRSLYDTAFGIRIPRNIQELINKILGEHATKGGTGLSKEISGSKALLKAYNLRFRADSLDIPLRGDETGRPRSESLVSPRESPDAEYERLDDLHQQAKLMFAAMERCLSPIERDVLARRILTEEPESLVAIGERHSLTRERIRQIEANALWKLRSAMGGSRKPPPRKDKCISQPAPGARRRYVGRPRKGPVRTREAKAQRLEAKTLVAPPKPGKVRSKYRGVAFDPASGRWLASLPVGKLRVDLGSFADEVSAAKAHDSAARRSGGKGAHTNFPFDRSAPAAPGLTPPPPAKAARSMPSPQEVLSRRPLSPPTRPRPFGVL